MARTITGYQMLQAGDRVLVGLSAGPDSSALAHALTLFAPRLKLAVEAAHVHHGIRADTADRDAEAARRLAERLGIPFVLRRVDAPGYARTHGVSLESAARIVRLAALEQIAQERSCRRVALGHTADDQAETVMMWVIRGTGPGGLAGIPPVRGVFVRPLIDVWRRDVLAYCERAGLQPVEDESNRSLRFLRNRIRLELLPYLESRFRPGVREALVRLAKVALDEHAFMQARADEAWEQAAGPAPQGSVQLDVRALRGMHPALARRVLVRAFEEVSGGRRGELGLVHVEALLAAARRGRGGALVQLPGGVTGRVARGRLHLERAPQAAGADGSPVL